VLILPIIKMNELFDRFIVDQGRVAGLIVVEDDVCPRTSQKVSGSANAMGVETDSVIIKDILSYSSTEGAQGDRIRRIHQKGWRVLNQPTSQ
jgi:hypothetical protein